MLLYIYTATTPFQVGLINPSSATAAVYRKYMLMETLRALVSLNGWEFCIIWKLSKDHRFLEWMDCCCAGAEIYLMEPGFAVSRCRDVSVPHSRTKACDLLAQFPSFVNVNDSRVYAETLLSNQPKCIHLSQYPNSDDTEAVVATRLLMHVQGGLVELFAATARQVSESQVLIDYIAENCNFLIENDESLIFSDEFMNQLYHPNLEDDVLLGMFSSLNDDPIQGNDEMLCGNVEMGRLSMISEDEADVEAKYRKKNGKEPQSKNLIAERKRRKKLNERLYKLRSLVPTISKLDRASILGDAIDFVKELQKQKKELEEQLQNQSDDDCELDSQYHEDNAGKCLRQTEVEVKRIDGGNNVLFVKMLCEKKACGFVRSLEALDHQGLEVIDVNVTTFGTLVSSVLQVQGKEGSWDMVDADCVKETLIEITSKFIAS